MKDIPTGTMMVFLGANLDGTAFFRLEDGRLISIGGEPAEGTHVMLIRDEPPDLTPIDGRRIFPEI